MENKRFVLIQIKVALILATYKNMLFGERFNIVLNYYQRKYCTVEQLK